ncbi:MAG: PIN domain-containing protein [Bacteroidota bacterium]
MWINYFRTGKNAAILEPLIESNLLLTNDLILVELIPSLKILKKQKLIELLKIVGKAPLSIDWEGLIEMRVICIKNGIDKIGMPDLIILQNVIQNKLTLFSDDKHFKLLNNFFAFNIYT